MSLEACSKGQQWSMTLALLQESWVRDGSIGFEEGGAKKNGNATMFPGNDWKHVCIYELEATF